MTDAVAAAYAAALEYCGSRVAAPEHHGAPILVSTLEETVVFPARRIEPRMPVVELIVQSDGVWVLSARYRDRLAKPFWSAFHRYPLGADGVPSLAGQEGADWRMHLDIDVTVAVGLLPAAGQALAGP